MHIKLKEHADPKKMNAVLKDMKSHSRFHIEEDNLEWLHDINHNPESMQSHLKPADRDLTLDELKTIFRLWTETSLLSADLSFGRTSKAEMKRLASFIAACEADILYIDGSNLLLERGDVPKKYHEVIHRLQKVNEEPKELPEPEQHKPDLENGLLLCKSFSPSPFWVVFGNVDKPVFLKEKVYENDFYNNVYRDSNDIAYLLIPLYDFSAGFADNVFRDAWSMGLREEPHFFLNTVYDYAFDDVNGVSEKLASFYTPDEIVERLNIAYGKVYGLLKANGMDGYDVSIVRNELKVHTFSKKPLFGSKIKMVSALYKSLVKSGYSADFNPLSSNDAFTLQKKTKSV